MSARNLTFVALAALLTAPALPAAEVILDNLDPAGVGLNDPTPVAPVAGNEGTTLGQQRLNVLQRAAELWADNLISDVPIRVAVETRDQPCTPTSAVLASAGTISIFRDFPGAPLPGTWYHSALADAITGEDLQTEENDILTGFNINLDDDPACLGGSGWYYGYDHDEGNQADLLAVMLHEYGHGLGFANFVDESSGTFFNDMPDVYSTYTRDLEVGLDWNAMNNTERQASAINDPDVVWTGPNVTEVAPLFLQQMNEVVVESPPGLGPYAAQSASFGPAVPSGGLPGDLVVAVDGTDTTTDGCEALTNGSSVDGNIALIERGNCNFSVKVANAQADGAIGVLIYNNAASGLPPMGGDDPTITIPSLGISQAAGVELAGAIAPLVQMGYDADGDPLGTNGGFLRLNAPDPVQPGSSISHWTPDATPSLLMEPAITPDLTDDVDLTLDHFKDIGWTLDLILFEDGFETGD